MYDTLEKRSGATLHHGATHNRVYLTEADKANWDALIPEMKNLAAEKNYDKIIGRVPENAIEKFKKNGYRVEATIPKLFNGETTGYFLADFLSKEREHCNERELKTIESVKTIAKAANNSQKDGHFSLPDNLVVRKLTRKDLFTVADLHQKAFKSYSFPIHKTDYLAELAAKNHEFYGLFDGDELQVSAILKMHADESNVEIVDFATHPDIKGQNLSYYLVQEIKKELAQTGYKTIYSLVRATSYGLNITFSKHDFVFGGTLMNNTLIRDTIESMNVWYYNVNFEEQ